MKNIGMRAKRNPWRNTRNDYNMPWNDIFAAIFMAILPLIVVIFASNIIISLIRKKTSFQKKDSKRFGSNKNLFLSLQPVTGSVIG